MVVVPIIKQLLCAHDHVTERAYTTACCAATAVANWLLVIVQRPKRGELLAQMHPSVQ